MSKFSQTYGSFERTGNYPLEAHYIFPTEAALKEFYQQELNASTIHKGMLRIVESDSEGQQALYWVCEGDNGLDFKKLIQNLDITSIDSQLDSLLKKLDKEIQDRKNADTDIYGTSDVSSIPETLNNISSISEAILELKEAVQQLKEDSETTNVTFEDYFKAITGSDQSNIVEYLKTLDYKNLTEISEKLHLFLDTIDESDTSINTFQELKEFLKGFEYTHSLYDCFTEFWNNIQGDPIPNSKFRTLRGIQDFVEVLASTVKNREDNLQKEIDQTQNGVGLNQDGSYSPDKATYYLKDTTSVIHSLKILDSLIHSILIKEITPSNQDVIPLDIQKTENGYTISASLTLSQEHDNQLIKKDGLFNKVRLDYSNGTVTLKVNDTVVDEHSLGFSALVEQAYYNSSTESIVINFKLLNGDTQTVTIPVGSLITEWDIENKSTSPIELTRTREIDGQDKLSADVRLWTNEYNRLKKYGNTLGVDGRTDYLIHSNSTYSQISLKSYLNQIITTEEYRNIGRFDSFSGASDKLASSEIAGNRNLRIIVFDVGTDINLVKSGIVFQTVNVNQEFTTQICFYDRKQQIRGVTGIHNTSTNAFRWETLGVQKIQAESNGTITLTDYENNTVGTAKVPIITRVTHIMSDRYTFNKSNDTNIEFYPKFLGGGPNWVVPEDIGDIKKGTLNSNLQKEGVEALLTKIIFKTIYPTITEPSIKTSNYSSTVEAGSTIKSSLVSYEFLKGTVTVGDELQPQLDYVGDATSTQALIKTEGGSANTNAGVSSYPSSDYSNIDTISRYQPGIYIYKNVVNYAAGPIMKNSKGNSPNPMPTTNLGEVANPHPAGSVSSTADQKVYVTLPVYIDTASGQYVKQGLKNWGAMTYSNVNMLSTSVANPIRIKTPRKLQQVNSYNSISGKYDVPQLFSFTMTPVMVDVNGEQYQYYEYVWNGGALSAVKMEIKTY